MTININQIQAGEPLDIALLQQMGNEINENETSYETIENKIINDDTDNDPYKFNTIEKTLSTGASVSGDVTELQFDNLVIGREYEITGQMRIYAANTENKIKFMSGAANTGTVYGVYGIYAWDSGGRNTSAVSVKFVASSTTLYSHYMGNSIIYGNDTREETFLQLRRVDNGPRLFAVESPLKHFNGTEKIIGTWFGETLYERSYELGAFSSGETIDTGLTKSQVTPADGWAKHSDEWYRTLVTDSAGRCITIYIDGTALKVDTDGSGVYTNGLRFTVQYTKIN